MEKIAVLGSNSFSGTHFVAYALSQGLDVLGISRSEEPEKMFLPYLWKKHEGTFRFEKLDLNHDTDRIVESIKAFKPEYVVNFAAQGMVSESWQHPEHWYQTNVLANVMLHEKIRHFDFLKKYVHVSTPEVYGSCNVSVREDAPFNPSTPYAASRAACELHLQTFLKNYLFPVVFTRSANVYGPGQQLYRIIPRTILCILLGRKLPLHGGGRSVRSFIHIRDVADGTLRVMREGIPGEAYNFSTTLNVSVREVLEMICRIMGANFEDVVDVVGDRPGKDAAYLLDSTKARETLHWESHIDLDPGVRETIAWVRENFEELKKLPMDYIHKQ